MSLSLATLSDEEIDCICDGYVQNSAKIRYLRSLGLEVRIKPNGRPLVDRRNFDLVFCGVKKAPLHATSNAPIWGVH